MHQAFLQDLSQGTMRAAYRDSGGVWVVDAQVKNQILSIFRESAVVQMGDQFCDKQALLPQVFPIQRGVRVVPGGTAVRAGAYVAPGVIIMPPSYVNVGAYVDEGTLIDSHVLVGSCAQIGKNVHLSAGVQIGGVLEPATKMPVIIEDDCFVGAHCCVVEGVWVRQGAVLAPGVILSASVPIYDCVHHTQRDHVPENAVVIPGSRPLRNSSWENLHAQCAVIIKYRDSKTNAATALEQALRV